MNKIISQSRCQDCEFHHVYKDIAPKKVRGVIMHYNQRYCLYGKKAMEFKNSDPKIIVPKWCLRQLRPPILRIYGFKDAQSIAFHNLFGQDMPLAHRYRMKCEFPREISPKELAEQKYVSFDNYVLLHGEVIEFDDGIRQLFFIRINEGLKPVNFDKTSVSI